MNTKQELQYPSQPIGEVVADDNGYPWKRITYLSERDLADLPIGAKVYAQPALALTSSEPDEVISVQQVWVAAGGNPGIKASKEDLLFQLKLLDEICDEADLKNDKQNDVQDDVQDDVQNDVQGGEQAGYSFATPVNHAEPIGVVKEIGEPEEGHASAWVQLYAPIELGTLVYAQAPDATGATGVTGDTDNTGAPGAQGPQGSVPQIGVDHDTLAALDRLVTIAQGVEIYGAPDKVLLSKRLLDVAENLKASTARTAQLAATAQSKGQSIPFDYKMAQRLLSLFDGGPGEGVYAYWSALPGEGSFYLGQSDEDAQADAELVKSLGLADTPTDTPSDATTDAPADTRAGTAASTSAAAPVNTPSLALPVVNTVNAGIAQPYSLQEILDKVASHDYNAEMLLQHALLLLGGEQASQAQSTVRNALSTNQAQWRNIEKVVRILAKDCFGSSDHPKWGICHQSLIVALAAKRHESAAAMGLEPLLAGLA